MPRAARGSMGRSSGEDELEYVVLVDGDDNRLGLEEKERCHLLDGRLHRAFTALIFDGGGRLALGRRSGSKMLWPGFWDGTFASHPRDGESYAAAAARRMPDEVGPACRMDVLFRFEYHARYGDVGSENEICATLAGTAEPDSMAPSPSEISELRWVGAGQLVGELEDPRAFCPWMLAAIHLLEPGSGVPAPWTDASVREAAGRAARAHMGGWRRLPQ